MIAAPLSSVYPGMGGRADHLLRRRRDRRHRLDRRRAASAALLVGGVDTFGKVVLPRAAGVLRVPADGDHPALETGGPIQARLIMHRSLISIIPRALAPIGLAIAPLFLGRYRGRPGREDLILGIFALSLELLVGRQVWSASGTAAFIGLGAYTTRFMLAHPGDPVFLAGCCSPRCSAPPLYALPVAALSACARAASTSSWSRSRSASSPTTSSTTPSSAGAATAPTWPGCRPVRCRVDAVRRHEISALLYRRWSFSSSCSCFSRLVLRSRFGRALAGIRANEQRMRAAGFATYPYKIAAFVIAAMLAGLAGFLLGGQGRLRQPRAARGTNPARSW